ncbi:catalase-like [Cimex lectularius]|uniref:Catalase core domain-containing protein n=1 Tax=Cimex lectularius TaxID=79782 RepID=A0A8I6TFH8_CIMLE|nr:catalase-like [Cimex lectularius]
MKYLSLVSVILISLDSLTTQSLNGTSELHSHETHSIPPVAFSNEGTSADELSSSQNYDKYDPLVIQDNILFDQIQSLNRERIPQRIVHPKGPGASGYLVITNDITKYSKAKVFTVQKRTRVTARFSRVTGDIASSDTVRDTRGFAMKFFTDDGIWDLLCNNSPVFFVRDPLRFPHLIHSSSRNPMTHLSDPNSVWDFFTLVPETLLQYSIINTGYGLPASFRHIDAFSINTFELVNANGTVVFCRFHFSTNQGLKVMPVEQANILAGTDPDFFARDLYNAIATGNYPSWNMSVQILNQHQVSSMSWNPFDPTKMWPINEIPEIPVGRLVLNQNPRNYFIEVESNAFNPANLVPGIQPSIDKVLQGRLFAYHDAQLYRTGKISSLLTANPENNKQRNGYAQYKENQWSTVNFYSNSFSGLRTLSRRTFPFPVEGNVSRYNTLDEDNFSQLATFWESLDALQQSELVTSLSSTLIMTYPHIQARAVSLFNRIHPVFGQSLNNSLHKDVISPGNS